MKWLKLLNPIAQRDSERAFWAIMFLPRFTAQIRELLRFADAPLSREDVVRISQEVAMRVAQENFSLEDGFFSKVELMNAANNLDYSSRSIANDVCRALDAGTIEKTVKNPLAVSPFDNLMREIFMAHANRAMQGAKDGNLKFSPRVVEQIIARNLFDMPI